MVKEISKQSLKRPKVVLLVALATLVFVFVVNRIPVERIRYSGGCRSEDIRLSLVFDGLEKVSEARAEIEKMNYDREERRKKYPGLSDGCSQGLSYAIYIL